jgi:hypothetical protein
MATDKDREQHPDPQTEEGLAALPPDAVSGEEAQQVTGGQILGVASTNLTNSGNLTNLANQLNLRNTNP